MMAGGDDAADAGDSRNAAAGLCGQCTVGADDLHRFILRNLSSRLSRSSGHTPIMRDSGNECPAPLGEEYADDDNVDNLVLGMGEKSTAEGVALLWVPLSEMPRRHRGL